MAPRYVCTSNHTVKSMIKRSKWEHLVSFHNISFQQESANILCKELYCDYFRLCGPQVCHSAQLCHCSGNAVTENTSINGMGVAVLQSNLIYTKDAKPNMACESAGQSVSYSTRTPKVLEPLEDVLSRVSDGTFGQSMGKSQGRESDPNTFLSVPIPVHFCACLHPHFWPSLLLFSICWSLHHFSRNKDWLGFLSLAFPALDCWRQDNRTWFHVSVPDLGWIYPGQGEEGAHEL